MSTKARIVTLLCACALLAAADLAYEKHGHLAVEDWPGFHGLVAILGGAALLMLARLFARLLRRGEDYYDADR